MSRAAESPSVQLHGGPDGFDKRDWAIVPVSESKLFSEKEKEAIQNKLASATIFGLTSPDGDQGYPGELYSEVLLALAQPAGQGELGSLLLIYRAKVTGKGGEKVVTPVNLTQV